MEGWRGRSLDVKGAQEVLLLSHQFRHEKNLKTYIKHTLREIDAWFRVFRFTLLSSHQVELQRLQEHKDLSYPKKGYLDSDFPASSRGEREEALLSHPWNKMVIRRRVLVSAEIVSQCILKGSKGSHPSSMYLEKNWRKCQLWPKGRQGWSGPYQLTQP